MIDFFGDIIILDRMLLIEILLRVGDLVGERDIPSIDVDSTPFLGFGGLVKYSTSLAESCIP